MSMIMPGGSWDNWNAQPGVGGKPYPGSAGQPPPGNMEQMPGVINDVDPSQGGWYQPPMPTVGEGMAQAMVMPPRQWQGPGQPPIERFAGRLGDPYAGTGGPGKPFPGNMEVMPGIIDDGDPTGWGRGRDDNRDFNIGQAAPNFFQPQQQQQPQLMQNMRHQQNLPFQQGNQGGGGGGQSIDINLSGSLTPGGGGGGGGMQQQQQQFGQGIGRGGYPSFGGGRGGGGMQRMGPQMMMNRAMPMTGFAHGGLMYDGRNEDYMLTRHGGYGGYAHGGMIHPQGYWLGGLLKGIGKVGAGIAGGALLGPLGAGLATGLFTGLTDKSLKKGIVSGLGAYVGAKAFASLGKAAAGKDVSDALAGVDTFGVVAPEAGKAVELSGKEAFRRGLGSFGELGVGETGRVLGDSLSSAKNVSLIYPQIGGVSASIHQDEHAADRDRSQSSYEERLQKSRDKYFQRFGDDPWGVGIARGGPVRRGYQEGGEFEVDDDPWDTMGSSFAPTVPSIPEIQFDNEAGVEINPNEGTPEGAGVDLPPDYFAHIPDPPEYGYAGENQEPGVNAPVEIDDMTEVYWGEGQSDESDPDYQDWVDSGMPEGGGIDQGPGPGLTEVEVNDAEREAADAAREAEQQAAANPDPYIPDLSGMYAGIDPNVVTGTADVSGMVDYYGGMDQGPPVVAHDPQEPPGSAHGGPLDAQQGGGGDPIQEMQAILSQVMPPEQIDAAIQQLIQKAGGDPVAALQMLKQMMAQQQQQQQNPPPSAGFIEGSGSGLGDDVTAALDGSEQVAVSDGEFVIPADVVSMMGDGNSKAGEEELYAMMDRVRQAKTGTTEQAGPLPPSAMTA